MLTATAKQTIARIWFYLAVAILVLTVWRIQVHMYQSSFADPTVVSQSASNLPPSDWQKMAAQTMMAANGLLITLGTALLGALGLMMSNKLTDSSGPRQHVWAAFLAAVCAGVSLYFGYQGHLVLLSMIYNENVTPYYP